MASACVAACAAAPQAQARPTGTWTCSDMLGTRRALDMLTKEHTTMIATGDHSEAVTERVEMAETEAELAKAPSDRWSARRRALQTLVRSKRRPRPHPRPSPRRRVRPARDARACVLA